jgi:hypothetical protein
MKIKSLCTANSGIMRAFLRCFAIVTAIAVLVVSEPNNLTKSQVTILKCCRHGEALQQSNDNSDEMPRCQPTKTQWKPLIYSPRRQTFVPILSEWHILDGRRPECDDQSELIFVPYRVSSPFFLMENNGAAVVDVNNPTGVPANRYCADSSALLICVQKKSMGSHAAATMRPRVRRCCGENATFHKHG